MFFKGRLVISESSISLTTTKHGAYLLTGYGIMPTVPSLLTDKKFILNRIDLECPPL
jgi:hypothetical protein